MRTKTSRKTHIILVLIVAALLLNTGCGEGAKLRPIYNSAILGAIVGGIVGYQSDETGEGVAIGAGVFALGEILSQIDDNPKPENKDESKSHKTVVREKIKEVYIIQIHNDNGSVTPVEIIKDGDRFLGPAGEYYPALPTEEQLKPFYGL